MEPDLKRFKYLGINYIFFYYKHELFTYISRNKNTEKLMFKKKKLETKK